VLLPGLIAFVLYSHHRRATAAAVGLNAGQRDQLALTADQNLLMTGDLNKAVEAYQQIVASNPNDSHSLDALGVVYARLGQYSKAVDAARRAMKLAPDALAPYEHLPYYYVALQQPEDAHQVIRDGWSKKMDSAAFHKVLYALAFLAQSAPDKPAMSDQVRWFGIHPEYESFGLALASNTAAYGGHLARSLDYTSRAVEAAVRARNNELAAAWQENAALREAAFGNNDAARQQAEAGLKLAPSSPYVEVEAALALAMIGDTARAETLASDVNKQHPQDTQMQSVWLPAIRAQIALQKKDAREAADDLASAMPLELGETSLGPTPTCMYSTYIRGQAYLAQDKGGPAATEFQKIVDHPGVVWNCWTGVLARVGLARAHALEADEYQDEDADRARARAVVAYKDFLKLWKDADPDIPLVDQAKQELDDAQQQQ
jgi:tetratricopeptide (TPR) repeat protein